jgi:hypothetical protein
LNSLRSLASRIVAMDGQAHVVQRAQLDADPSAALEAEFQAARAAEYREIVREAELLLAHVARETEHREFTYAELEELEQDLGKLKRWADQVHDRDYFAESSFATVQALIERCEGELETFLEQAAAGESA